ncbi:hypothetical protein FKP32DRAFT_1677502 [Trametes sanguinea]|nr:hypothetical protein FKP32DRAFT_1677502 [Trametes sanguinea]
MRELQHFIDELRDLGRRFPLKEPQYGSWPSGPYHNSYYASHLPATPFHTVSEFHDYWLKRLDKTKSDAETHEDLQLLLSGSACHASTPVLCYGDLAPRNILVKDDRIVGIVDWETFSWYPAFWEEMAARNELMSKRLSEAQRDVFGEISWESEVGVYLRVYNYVTALL